MAVHALTCKSISSQGKAPVLKLTVAWRLYCTRMHFDCERANCQAGFEAGFEAKARYRSRISICEQYFYITTENKSLVSLI